MRERTSDGVGELMRCLGILQDLELQLSGDAQAAVESIARRGALSPITIFTYDGELDDETREKISGQQLEYKKVRQNRRALVRQAVRVVQGIVREMSQTTPLSDLWPKGRGVEDGPEPPLTH